MTRRLPIIATIVVVAAAAVMVGLGVWQIQRAQWKEAMLARYAKAATLPPIAFPTMPPRDDALPLFRHATGLCLRPVAKRTNAGANRDGEPGFLFIVDCTTGAEGPGMSVELGWSKNPQAAFKWNGGPVSGIIAPDKQSRMRLVIDEAPAGLKPSAPPSIGSISNNHRFYAAQWFFFAALAVVIYVLALRKRWKDRP